MKNQRFDLVNFIPNKIICGKNFLEYDLNYSMDDIYISFSYVVEQSNGFRNEYSQSHISLSNKNK